MPEDSKVPVVTDMMAKEAAARMMTDPMNSKRTASQRFALTEGKYARRFASMRHSFSIVNLPCCRYARMVETPPRDS